jgi:phosphatidylinositol dimannoside acyltransferase
VNARLVDLQYAAAWRVVRILPERVARTVFRLGADLAVRRNGNGVRQLRANLARVAPGAGLEGLVSAGMRSYARYWCETFRLSASDAACIVAATAVTNTGPFDEALDAGRGLIIALSHSGNWDAAGVWLIETLRLRGLDPAFTTVAQRLKPDSVFRRFIAHREALGFELVAAEDGAYRALLARLRRGGVVCVLADRDVLGTGLDVTLLGEPARLPSGPARLAAFTGATLLPTRLGFAPSGWTIAFADPVPVPGPADVAKATQSLADALGTLVAGDPSDWHVLQPLWTADQR